MGTTSGPTALGASPTGLEKLHASGEWQRLQREFFETGNAAAVHAGLTAVIDRLAREAFGVTIATAFPKGAAMMAVGGFGRRELFPYSDVDIMILLDSESLSGSIKDSLSGFVRLLWDAGLRLSHSVHTVNECLEVHEQNIELNISLLDRRFLSGDHDVFAKLEGRFPGFLSKHGQKLGKHLCDLTHQRHTKYQETLFHLEPDVKETPGGLRDLHFINWLARLRPEQRSETALDNAAAFLSSLRCFLHYQAGRDRNILNFEAQESITEQAFSTVKTAPLWMREYFRNARIISQEAMRTLDACERDGSSLLTSFRDWRSRLSNSEFSVIRERVFLRSPGLLESDPEIVFRLMEFIARHGIPPSAETERRLESARASFTHWCAAPRPLWKTLKHILVLPHALLALRLLQDTGYMQVFFPEWESILSLVVRDFYHRYTVDEHTLVAIERIATLRATTDPDLAPFASLLAEVDNPAVLLFSLLFHDVGKGAMSGDHSRISAEWARTAMARIQMPADEQQAVEFLIANHLVLSEVMTTRDLGDPTTARSVADKVGTIEQLKLLTVMTYADISAVNPGAMTPWRLEQLWRVFRVTQQELTRELETERIQEIPRELPERAEFIKGFPVRYLRTHPSADIEMHLGLYQASRPTGVALDLTKAEGAYRLTVVARDMPFLFASLAGALSSFGLDILKAEAFSNSKGIILDTFVFADPKRTLDLNPSEADRLQDLIRRVATGKTDVQRLLRSRPQTETKRRGTPPNVGFDSEACDTATLVEISADDRPGLLYSLATVFSTTSCNIDVVLIDTKGHRAIDVFYVAQQGHKLSEDMQSKLKERLLAAC